jgi:RNA polymerase sigma factor (sigma-70 family)
MGSTDLELLRRYAEARDAEAFAELVARHRDMVYAACYRVLDSRADAEDSAQESFLRLAGHAASVRTSVAGWLHRVAVRASIAAQRKQRTRRRAEREAAVMEDRSADASWDEVKTEIDRAIDRLPDRLREPVVLHFLEGKPQVTVAEELGLSQASVSRRLKEGVEELRRHLKRTGLAVSVGGLGGLLTAETGEAAPAALIAELGKIALAGVGAGSTQAAGVGLSAVLTSKSTIACTVVTGLAVVGAVQYAINNATPSRQPATPAAAIQAAVAPGSVGRVPERAARVSGPDEQIPVAATTMPTEAAAANRVGHHPGARDQGGEPPARGSSPPTPDPPAATHVAQASPEGQPARQAPAVGGSPADMTDPAAVVRAYTDACRRGDVEGALALTNVGEEMVRPLADEIGEAAALVRDYGMAVLKEYLLLPTAPESARVVGESTFEGDTARVTATVQPPELTFVLARQEDGTWRIDLEASIVATTQEPASFVFTDARSSLGPLRIDWAVRQALYEAGKHVIRYARETGRYPRAESWMDDVEAHCMVRGAFDLSDALGGKYGLAMNASISGVPYDDNWPARRKVVGLFISSDASRNASGDPNVVLSAADEGIEGVAMWLASEEVVTVPHGMSMDEAVRSVDDGEVSRQRIEAILQGLLSYARDNKGKLPPADSWCDLVLLYAPTDQNANELFWCPATPGLDYAWAINEDLAGEDIRTIEGHDRQVLVLPAKDGVRNEARAVPETVKEGRYLVPWSEGPGLVVRVGTLNGETRLLREGQPYPRLPVAEP